MDSAAHFMRSLASTTLHAERLKPNDSIFPLVCFCWTISALSASWPAPVRPSQVRIYRTEFKLRNASRCLRRVSWKGGMRVKDRNLNGGPNYHCVALFWTPPHAQHAIAPLCCQFQQTACQSPPYRLVVMLTSSSRQRACWRRKAQGIPERRLLCSGQTTTPTRFENFHWSVV